MTSNDGSVFLINFEYVQYNQHVNLKFWFLNLNMYPFRESQYDVFIFIHRGFF